MKYLVLAIGLLLVVSNLADGLSLRERLAQQKNETKLEGSSDDATTTIEPPKGPALLLKEVDFAETNCTGNVCNTTQDTCECTGVCEYVFSQNPCFCKRDWHCHDTSIVNRTSRAANSTIAKPVVSPNVGPASSAEDSDDDADHDDDTDEDNSGEDGPTTRIRRDTTDSERDARRKDNVPINCAIQSCSPHQQNPNATTDSHNSSHGKPDHGKHNSTTDSPNSSHGKHNSTNGSHTNGARDQPIATPPSPQGSRARRGANDSKPALDQGASNTRQNSTTIRPALQQDAKNNSQSKVTSQGPRTTLGGADAKQDSPAPQPARASSQDDDDDDDDDDTPVATKTTRTRRGAPLATQGSNKNVTSPKPTPQPTHPPTTPKTTRSRRGAPLATQGSNKNVTSPKPTPQPTHPPTTPKTTRSRRGAPLATQGSNKNVTSSKPTPQPANPPTQEDNAGNNSTATPHGSRATRDSSSEQTAPVSSPSLPSTSISQGPRATQGDAGTKQNPTQGSNTRQGPPSSVATVPQDDASEEDTSADTD